MERSEDKRPILWWVLLVLILSFGLLMMTSCSPRIVERIVSQRDTTYVVRRDSVHFYDRDSVFIREKGDTVYQYVEKWRYRDRWKVDTLVRVKVDSVAVERIVEVEVEKPLSTWRKWQIWAFWWLVAAIVLLLAWTQRKRILKLVL